MVQEKTQKKVLKVIEGLKAGKNLTQALKAAKMLRGHYYSARDAMLRDGDKVVQAYVQSNGGLVPTKKKPRIPLNLTHEKQVIDNMPANVVQLPPSDMQRLHAQALRENDRLKWAEQLIEEIKGTKKRQTEILKKLMIYSKGGRE